MAAGAFPQVEVDHAAARRSMREQIARLERQLAEALVTAFPHDELELGVDGHDGPRVLGLGELEAQRDALEHRVRNARKVLTERGERIERNRILLEKMLLEPQRHKYVRLPAVDVGERGCGAYHVRPRLGIVGMLLGWWHVKLSSGCPLATSHGTP